MVHLPEPMVGSRDGRHGHTETERCDLSTVEEVCAEETDGDEGVEQVDEDASYNLRRRVFSTERGGNGQRNHTACHTGARDHEDGTTSEAVDGEEGDKGRQEFPSQSATSKSACILGAHAQVVLENNGSVDRNQIGTTVEIVLAKLCGNERQCGWTTAKYLRHLLKELQEHAKPKAIQKLILAHGENVAQLDLVASSLLE